jgi:hypothetical protein
MSEFVILDTVGLNYVVGTSKGNVGVMAKSVMEDLDLYPSDRMGAMVVPPKTSVYRIPHYLPVRIDAQLSELYPSKVAAYDVEEVSLDIRYCDLWHDLFAGYSPRAKLWVFWTSKN